MCGCCIVNPWSISCDLLSSITGTNNTFIYVHCVWKRKKRGKHKTLFPQEYVTKIIVVSISKKYQINPTFFRKFYIIDVFFTVQNILYFPPLLLTKSSQKLSKKGKSRFSCKLLHGLRQSIDAGWSSAASRYLFKIQRCSHTK